MNIETDRRLLTDASSVRRSRGGLWRVWETLSAHYGLTLLVCLFGLPTLWAVLFYGVIASDRYVSEAKVIVRGVNSQQIGGLSVLLRSFGLSRANDDAYAIQAYLTSRDAMSALMSRIDLREVYSVPEADFLTGYHPVFSDTTEGLYKYFTDQVEVREDMETGITTLRVSAFRAEDARAIARAMLDLGEQRVNEMNGRARRDALEAASELLRETEQRVFETQRELTVYRNSVLMVDPEENVTKLTEVIAELTAELVDAQVTLRQLRESSPSNPRIGPLETRIASLREQIAERRGEVAGSDTSIASKLSRYEELVLKRTLADKAFEGAMRTIDNAREEAQRKRIYIEAVVSPNLPDKSTEPKRLRRILTIVVISFAIFVMVYLLVSGGRDHLNIH